MVKEKKENPMRRIEIEKIVLNIGVGELGEKLEQAKTILERITGKKPVYRKTRKRTTFGVAKGRDIGVIVTLRKDDAVEILKRLFKAVEGKLNKRCFSERTFSFGIEEYISIPGTDYDPKIGIVGLDICVALRRPGFKKGIKVGKKHQISSEEAQNFIKENFDVEIV
jgi:large subunit ribosomal protein L5